MSMRHRRNTTCACLLALLPVFVSAEPWTADERAPLERYLIADEAREIALALSAAPAHISADAGVLVLTENGHKEARKSGNGFVCLVERSWGGPFAMVVIPYGEERFIEP